METNNALYEHCKRLEHKLLSLEYENKRLNKALDKACEFLVKDGFFCLYCKTEECMECTQEKQKEQWKAWVLNENT